jgi:type VI secretion system ImpA family protein
VAYDSSFGSLNLTGQRPAPAGGEKPFRIAVVGGFSGRQGRVPPESREAIAARKPRKITFDTLEDVLEALGPKLEYTVGDDVAVELEPTELDDFHPDAIYNRVDKLSDLEGEEAAQLMRAILHHPAYQSLESAWRGTEWLLRRVQKTDKIQVVLCDVSAEEFAADLMADEELSSSAVCQLLIQKTAEAPEGDPWALIVGLYTFNETAADAEVLGRMSRIAARANAPFLAAMTPAAVKPDYEVPAEGKEAAAALRKLPEAAYLGLTTPRFLLRPPFGENYRPADSLTFEEFSSGETDGYLWGNPGLACAALLARGFMQSGWAFQPARTLALDSMPMHSFRDADGEPTAVCAEGKFTSTTSQELVKRGFMPLLSVRGRDSIELACIRSLSGETNALAGPWKGAAPTKPPAQSGLPSNTVGMMSGKGSGVAAPRRDDGGFVSADAASRGQSSDPEIDPDLAALMAESSEPPTDDAPTGDEESPPADDTPSEESPPDESAAPEMDPELAALLGDSPAAQEAPAAELDPELAALLGDSPPAGDAPAAELDPELAALLGESLPSGDAPAEDAPAAELDPELAALLGDSPPAAESDEGSAPELDPELAALLGEAPAESADNPPSDEPPTDEPPTDEPPTDEPPSEEPRAEEATAEESPAETAEMDPELAALLGESLAESSAGAEADLDPELAALLGESSSPDAEPEPEPAVEPEQNASPATMDSAMSSVSDDDAGSAPAAVQTPEQIGPLIQRAQEATKFGGPNSGSPPLLDFKSLLLPISEEEPAGGGVPFDVREQLEQARKEVNPEAFAPDDPLRPEDFVKADWKMIIGVTQDTLRGSSKNLLVGARLLEALAKQYGLMGLRDGLHFMRLLCAVCWDRMDPPWDPDDPEVRAGPFHWLDDPDRGACFPNSVRSLPIITAGGASLSWQQWQQGQAGGANAELVERTIAAASRDQCQLAFDNLSQALLELRQLTQFLSSKLGPEAPGFTALRPAIEESRRLAQQILQKKGPAGDSGAPAEMAMAAGEASADGAGAANAGYAASKPRYGTREDIYKELATAADALERLEPHSPVPFLVRRAVELGALPFPLLMQALIRDAGVLSEMNRELGIKQAE